MVLILIKSINKIAIVAFFITSFLIGYEIYLLLKDRKGKRKPFVPQFKSEQKYGEVRAATVIKATEEKTIYKKPNLKLMIFFIILMFFFGGVFLLGTLIKENTSENQSNIVPTPIIKTISSTGIKIYNEKWEEIPDEKLSFLKKGDKIFVGVKNIVGVDIDKARIRFNSYKWRLEDEVSVLNQKLNLFYKEYQIATNETQLKIEAQLHSQKEGWLGE